MRNETRAAGRARLESALQGDEAGFAALHDLMTDPGYDSKLIERMIVVARDLRYPPEDRRSDGSRRVIAPCSRSLPSCTMYRALKKRKRCRDAGKQPDFALLSVTRPVHRFKALSTAFRRLVPGSASFVPTTAVP
jgi:hypothetical protein